MVTITRGAGPLRELLDSASRGLGTQPPLRPLGEQRLGGDRMARYYIRTVGGAPTYTMVAVAVHQGWIVIIVGVDSLRDPAPAVRARVLQTLVLGIGWPR